MPYLTNDTLANFWGAAAQGYRFNNQHQATYNTYDYVGTLNFKLRPYLSSKTSGGVQYYTNYNTYLSAEGDFFPAPGLQTISSAGTIQPTAENWTAEQHARLLRPAGVRVQRSPVSHRRGARRQQQRVRQPGTLGHVSEDQRLVRRRARSRRSQQHLPSWLNSLRLRAAYGGSGQQPSLNTALQTLAPVAGPLGRSILTPSQIGNPNLKPERVLGTELGFETGMFHDRFGIDFTYFHDDSRDAILSRGVAPGTGFGDSTTSSSTPARS